MVFQEPVNTDSVSRLSDTITFAESKERGGRLQLMNTSALKPVGTATLTSWTDGAMISMESTTISPRILRNLSVIKDRPQSSATIGVASTLLSAILSADLVAQSKCKTNGLETLTALALVHGVMLLWPHMRASHE